MIRVASKSFIKVNGVNICYELADYTDPWADKEPEVFVLQHGFARTMDFFRSWVPLLSRHFVVIRVDGRGSGASDKPAIVDESPLAAYGRDILAIMDAMGIDRAHWVGESSGGISGLMFAQQHPERLHTLTLVNTPFKRPAAVKGDHLMGEESAAAAMTKYGVGGWSRRNIDLRLDMTRATPKMVDWVCDEMDKTPIRWGLALNNDISKADFFSQLHTIKVPTLILASGGSRLAQTEEMQQMQRAMPVAQLKVFPEYGHGLNLFAPEACVAAIFEFHDWLKSARA